ncbi:MAG: hypothetical protein A2042_09315 [Candidatus Schekmanbacteria bacterium GWA2_38_11]|uniref:Uncharacterized protein n=1 Tax=Candidatus Schekmanbacteria bacterium GWA2_38_11 TaxID=1817876 RepID=A0A1F7RLR0_9BACT|nr:MAG: hypothetical protein A2042_09315 [Candidatus Schekmanbacteria bacterium GWA2_38_11]
MIGIDLGKIFKGNLKEAVNVVNRVKEEHRSYLYSGIGRASILLFKDDFEKSVAFIEKIPPSYRDFCYQGIFYETVMHFHKYSPINNGWDSEWDIAKVIELLEKVDEKYKSSSCFGIGRGIMSFEFYYAESRRYLFSDLVWKSGKALEGIEASLNGYCFQGIGVEYGRKLLNYFFAQDYFQPEQGYSLDNRFFSEPLNKEINRTLKGDKTLKGDDRENYYEGIKMAVLENFKDEKVRNYILNRIRERERSSGN